MMPFIECTRFKTCSVNQCPLHPNYPDIYTDGDDTEPKCTLPKSYRLKVAENFKGVLKFEGLTKREYAAKMSWESKSDEERARIIDGTKNFRFVSGPIDEIESTCVSVGDGL